MLLAVLLLRILSRQATNAMAVMAFFETTAIIAMHHAKTALDARSSDDDDDDGDQNQFFNTTRTRPQRLGVHGHPLLFNVWALPRLTRQHSSGAWVRIVPSAPSAQLIRPPR